MLKLLTKNIKFPLILFDDEKKMDIYVSAYYITLALGS